MPNVLITGSFDLLHSGHVYFMMRAAEYGDLYVGIGPDKSILELKGRPTINNENERLFMVKSMKYVTAACINAGMGLFDFFDNPGIEMMDILIVNKDQDFPEKREFCKKRGIEYIVFEEKQCPWLPERSSTQQREYVKLREC